MFRRRLRNFCGMAAHIVSALWRSRPPQASAGQRAARLASSRPRHITRRVTGLGPARPRRCGAGCSPGGCPAAAGHRAGRRALRRPATPSPSPLGGGQTPPSGPGLRRSAGRPVSGGRPLPPLPGACPLPRAAPAPPPPARLGPSTGGPCGGCGPYGALPLLLPLWGGDGGRAATGRPGLIARRPRAQRKGLGSGGRVWALRPGQ